MSDIGRLHINNFYLDNPLKCGNTFIIQIGRLLFDKDTIIESHFHSNYFELTIVTGGKGIIYANGIGSDVSKGDIFLSLPYETHKLISDPNNLLEYDFLSFYTDNEILRSGLEAIVTNGSPNNRIFTNESINMQLSYCINELMCRDDYSEMFLASSLDQILIETIRSFNNDEQRVVQGRYSNSELLCFRMMSYIDSHLFSMKSLSELAESINYNYSYLSDVFKTTTGKTIQQYYSEKRFEVACTLLLYNKMKISDIANSLQYANVYSFSKAFKQKYGVSPIKYKNQSLKNGYQNSSK